MYKKLEKIFLGICLITAFLLRIINIGKFPGGMNVDEAFAGYEAWCLLNYGTDSWGIHNPVYLTTWGSGMSVLNSVLMIPFVKVFGLETFAIRIPQVLLGVLSIWIMFRLLLTVYDRKIAITALIFMSICPWFFMTDRFAMDCNLAPDFVLFGFYSFVKSFQNKKYLYFAAVMWGLSLYCYAAIWIFLPLFIICLVACALKMGKLKFDKHLLISGFLLFIMAFPLLLFVMVNMGIMDPVYTNLISIPKLIVFRSNEISLKNVLWNGFAFLKMMLTQNDGLIWNTTKYGMYYLISVPFILLGFVVTVKRMLAALKARSDCFECYWLIWLILSTGCGILQGVNSNKMNLIHIPVTIMIVLGIVTVIDWIKSLRWKAIYVAVISASYGISCGLFFHYYFTAYQKEIGQFQMRELEVVLEDAEEIYKQGNYDYICFVNTNIRHPSVLFYRDVPLDVYLNTVEWSNYPDGYLTTESFGYYLWRDELNLEQNNVYIIQKSNNTDLGMKEENFLKEYDDFIIAY